MALQKVLLLASLLCLSLAAAQTSAPKGGSWSSQEDTAPKFPGDPSHPDDDSAEEYEDDYDYGDEQYDYNLDLDSEEDMSAEEDEEVNRIKRKVIFGGGGGYSGVGRRSGGGGDPYGRRRSNHNYHGPGPDYGQYGSWPYGGRGDYVDTSSFDRAGQTTQTTIQPKITTTQAPQQRSRSRSYAVRPDQAQHQGSTRKRQGRRETKEKLSKALKQEIARYALEHSTQEAVHHFSARVGRRLSRKKVEKFVQRYQQRLDRGAARN